MLVVPLFLFFIKCHLMDLYGYCSTAPFPLPVPQLLRNSSSSGAIFYINFPLKNDDLIRFGFVFQVFDDLVSVRQFPGRFTGIDRYRGRAVSEQLTSNLQAISKQFQSNSRATPEQFRSNFLSTFEAISKQLQSNSRAISEQFSEHFRSNFWAQIRSNI